MDRILFFAALFSIIVVWQWVHVLVGESTPMVRIFHAKTLLASYPLTATKPVYYDAQGDVGGADIVIEGGHVRMIHSTCASKACVLSGEHHQLGDMIVCVPNRILVLIDGQKDLRLDAVTE
ncbi:MAG: NusG domain II-containing protein [Mariprofundaceae bacterium]|nr:NusG domain II-containing protein [Mariprofundaceae bacterium]